MKREARPLVEDLLAISSAEAYPQKAMKVTSNIRIMMYHMAMRTTIDGRTAWDAYLGRLSRDRARQ